MTVVVVSDPSYHSPQNTSYAFSVTWKNNNFCSTGRFKTPVKNSRVAEYKSAANGLYWAKQLPCVSKIILYTDQINLKRFWEGRVKESSKNECLRILVETMKNIVGNTPIDIRFIHSHKGNSPKHEEIKRCHKISNFVTKKDDYIYQRLLK